MANHETSDAPGLSSVAHFDIQLRRYLDVSGKPLCELPGFARDRELLTKIYRHMVVTRAFDEKAIALQRTGRLGTYASALGQEAVGVCVAACMQETDVLLPSFREHGAQLCRGVTMDELLLFWGGDERGNDFSGPQYDFPNCIPVASHFPHAVGVALALKSGQTDDIAVAMAGDGATSKGEFYEALNIAGAWRLPVLFVIVNNGWAISVPRSAQTAAATLAQKAIAAGIPSEQVDGNDAIAMVAAVRSAIETIRSGKGPILIEALTYRLSDHTTADDASRYRSDEEVSHHWKEEPVSRLRGFMTSSGMWAKQDEHSLIEEARMLVAEAAEKYLAHPPQSASSIFDHLFHELPPSLIRQHDFLMKQEATHNG
jgi:pyruvate dehydrogenase E1 component alpha subunit